MADVMDNPDFVAAPRGMAVREKIDYMFKILNPTSEPLVTKDLDRNAVIADYTKKEMELYNSMTNRVEKFADASKFWNKIANPDGTINSAYGYLIWQNPSFGNPKYELSGSEWVPAECNHGMRTPWEWALTSLKKDKFSRQAFIKFSLPEHHWDGCLDQTCTMHGNFLIRDNKLSLTVVMRSNDIVLGLAYDLPWFCSLLDRMLVDLKSTYPKVTKGTYTHLAHSFHIYNRDTDKIMRMLGR